VSQCPCEDGRLRAAFRADLDRYVYCAQESDGYKPFLALRVGLRSPGLWATTAYRLDHDAQRRPRRRVLITLLRVFHVATEALTGIHIDKRAHIGPGLQFPHGGRTQVGPILAGSNCDILHGVTLGRGNSVLSERPSEPDVPTLGNRVWIGPGAVVAGKVTVNDDAVVAANSLLVQDAPQRGVMIGVPARLVSKHGSFNQIAYRDMAADSERESAVAAALAANSEPMRRPRSVSGLPASSQ
jgi:serine O-acetyltransferase